VRTPEGTLVRKTSSAFLRSGLAFAGVLVIAVIVWKTGWASVRANLLLIGPWFLVLVALNLVTQAAFVFGLRSVLEPRPRWLHFPRLYGVYLMGDAANYLVPGGGEAAKAHLLRDLGGGQRAMAAITLHKHADLVAQCAFAVLGVSAALFWFELPRAVAAAAVLGTLALLALLFLMTWALGRGAFSPILRRLTGWKFLAARLQRFHSAAEGVDARIALFHAVHRGRFLLAAFFSLLGYCGGLVETWIVLRLLAPSAGWPAMFVIESLPMVLNNAILFVPGKLGGAEGIRTGVFVLVGLSASQGAAYALMRRTRELFWILPGWALLVRERLRDDHRGLVHSRLREEATDA
jgi:uncharacterized protein (TIRG00374 family)